MKYFLYAIISTFFYCSTANAYIDDRQTGEAEATAGEQNSNLYRLNASSTMSIKKLKKLDELYAKEQISGKRLTETDIEKLLDLDDNKTQKELDLALKDAIKKTKNTRDLVISIDIGVYNQFKNFHQISIKDREIAKNLTNNLGRRK